MKSAEKDGKHHRMKQDKMKTQHNRALIILGSEDREANPFGSVKTTNLHNLQAQIMYESLKHPNANNFCFFL